MRDRNRLAAIALGIALAFGLVLSPEHQRPCGETGEHDAAAEGSEASGNAPPKVVKTPPRPSGALNADVATEREEQRAEQDLRAQRQMSAWAFLTMLATVFGVLLVYRTLRETKAALGQARRAADAAVETISVTREIGEAQTRGYVSIVPRALSVRAEWVGYVVGVRCEGGSPIYDFAVQAIYSHFDHNALRRYFACTGDDFLGEGGGTTLFPGDPKEWFGRQMQMPSFTGPTMSSGGLNLRIELRFWWTDAFGKRQSRDIKIVGSSLSNKPHSTIAITTVFAGETVTHTEESESRARQEWDQRTGPIRAHNLRSLGALDT